MKDTSRGITRLVGWLALVAATALARPAAAVPGSGIRLGGSEGRLHPYVELEPRYDSNVYYGAAAKSVGDLILHVRPGFRLDVPGDLTAVDLNASLDWAQYLGIEGDTTGLSRLFGQAALGIGVNRRGTLGLELDDDFRRSSGSDALSLGSAVVSNRNDLRVSVPWTPGGGALVLTLAGRWHLETFEPYVEGRLCSTTSLVCDSALVSKLDYSELRGDAELKWKFLPRTAAVLEAGWFSHLASSSVYGVDVSGLRTRTGLTGLLTAHFAGTLKAGYADTFGSAPKPFRTWLGTAELDWIATETASIRVGYEHDLGVDPGTLFSLYEQNRAYADGRILLASRYTARLGLHYDHRTYVLAPDSSSSIFWVEPSVEAEVARWMVVSLAYDFTSRDSKLLPTTSSAIPGFDYSKNEAWVRARFTY